MAHSDEQKDQKPSLFVIGDNPEITRVFNNDRITKFLGKQINKLLSAEENFTGYLTETILELEEFLNPDTKRKDAEPGADIDLIELKKKMQEEPQY